MIVKVLIRRIIFSVILVDALQWDFNGPFGSNVEDCCNQDRSYGYGVINIDGETILKFFTAIYMKMGNTLFKKVTLHLVAYESGQSKT